MNTLKTVDVRMFPPQIRRCDACATPLLQFALKVQHATQAERWCNRCAAQDAASDRAFAEVMEIADPCGRCGEPNPTFLDGHQIGCDTCGYNVLDDVDEPRCSDCGRAIDEITGNCPNCDQMGCH